MILLIDDHDQDVYYIDTPSEYYPEGMRCPYHQRFHNSHGWYICVPADHYMPKHRNNDV